MYKIFFEDNPNSPVSKLLSSSYLGKFMYFSEGISSLPRLLNDFVKPSDEVYVFVDVVPDNGGTVRWLRIIEAEFSEQKNVHAIPIFCIEYVVLKMLTYYGYVEDSNVSKAVHIDEMTSTFKFKEKTLEKLYKRLLSGSQRLCMHNKCSADKPRQGMFYTKDCDCLEKFCSLHCSDSLSLKAERLVSKLPCFPTNAEYKSLLASYGILLHDVEIANVLHEIQEFYTSVCSVLGVPTIRVV